MYVEDFSSKSVQEAFIKVQDIILTLHCTYSFLCTSVTLMKQEILSEC